jgi:hypothetical protein
MLVVTEEPAFIELMADPLPIGSLRLLGIGNRVEAHNLHADEAKILECTPSNALDALLLGLDGGARVNIHHIHV